MSVTLVKTPDEIDVFAFNLTERVPAGRTIVSATVTSSPAGLTLSQDAAGLVPIPPAAPTVAGPLVEFWLAGGTGGQTYLLTCDAMLDDGRRVGEFGPLYVRVK